VTQPVDLQVGNDGAIYYLDRLAGQVRRITHAVTNTPPVITGQPSSVTVAVGQPASFSVSAEGTPPLTFQWQRDGIDIPDANSTTYTLPTTDLPDSGASFTATVHNVVSTVPSNAATLTVLDNGVPTATITEPEAGTTYSAGDTLSWAGTGFDPETGNLPGTALTWRIDFHHDTHFHPFVPDTTADSGSALIPTVPETSPHASYRTHLT